MYHTRDKCPFLAHMLNHSAMANNFSCQTQIHIMCPWNNTMYRWDIWTRKLLARCRDREIKVLKPGIGSVLENPPTDPLKLQDIKIVYMFTQHELCIHLSKEIQGYFLVVMWWHIKNHIPYVHLVINKWLKFAPLNRDMWPIFIWDFPRARVPKQCKYVIFGYFQLFDYNVVYPINIFLSFYFSI